MGIVLLKCLFPSFEVSKKQLSVNSFEADTVQAGTESH